jgi:transcriptional regulator with XRE-family HTH domain
MKENLPVDPDEDVDEQRRMGARLREAREYIGLLQEDVAGALSIPRASVSALELRRLARLYRRSVGWLLGEEDPAEREHDPLYRATETLSAEDKDQVLRFAEFLAAAGSPSSTRRRAAASRGDSPASEPER